MIQRSWAMKKNNARVPTTPFDVVEKFFGKELNDDVLKAAKKMPPVQAQELAYRLLYYYEADGYRTTGYSYRLLKDAGEIHVKDAHIAGGVLKFILRY